MRPRQFHTTGAQPCPYLGGREERRIFTALRRHDGELAVFERLSEAGFRRSQNLMYRPACIGCDACVPVRIPVERHVASRSERKTLRRNADLVIGETPAVVTDELWALFHRYLEARHADGGMAGMTREAFESMVGDWSVATFLLEARDPSGRLVAVSLTDRLSSGLSGVYKFYDPAEARRGLGTWLILSLVEHARKAGLPYVYLGYWIAGSAKMAYKARFRPLERLGADGWVELRELPALDEAGRPAAPPAEP